MNPKLWLNRNNLIYNLRHLKKHTTSSFVCPMVKANAYGVGDALVVSTLLSIGVKHFGVARIFEAEKLRRSFPNDEFELLVFHPLVEAELESYLVSEITPVLSSFEDLKLIALLSADKRSQLKPVHLKFDLGMNRLGFSLPEQDELKSFVDKLGIQVGGVCGHFPTAGDFGEPAGTSEPLMLALVKAAQNFGVKESAVHIPNSEALGKGQFNVGIRPGICVYGVSKFDAGLRGALRLTAPAVSVRDLEQGSSVSYSGSWTADRAAKLAILPIGYADGLRRGLSNRISFKREGVDFKQVGTICMDYCMVLLENSKVPVSPGDDFILFDEDLMGLQQWSDLLGTIPYELLTGLGNRVERRVT